MCALGLIQGFDVAVELALSRHCLRHRIRDRCEGLRLCALAQLFTAIGARLSSVAVRFSALMII